MYDLALGVEDYVVGLIVVLCWVIWLRSPQPRRDAVDEYMAQTCGRDA